jgi:hypothetical protein
LSRVRFRWLWLIEHSDTVANFRILFTLLSHFRNGVECDLLVPFGIEIVSRLPTIDLCTCDASTMDLAVLRSRSPMQFHENLYAIFFSKLVDFVNVRSILVRLHSL